MQVRWATAEGGRLNRTHRSITGTTEPLRLITPRMNGGMRGTSVIPPNWITSRIDRMSMAKVSPPRLKARYCSRRSTGAAARAWVCRLLNLINSAMVCS